ncbi:MAG: hypothetical protein OEY56_06935 [Cyclobacteriaceae bacterium]|nr:hypothetical protein [Cyclobacteriaceae bacterium]
MKTFILSLLTILMLSGCSSGKKAMEKGDYDRAVYQAVNRLQSKSSHKKATVTLKKAYQYALNLHRDNIQFYQNSPDELKWESVIREYQLVNNLYNQINRCPACLQAVPNPVRYVRELNDASEKAAQVRYDMGVAALQQKQRRDQAIEAHQHFLRALELSPRFKNAQQLAEEAYQFAVLRVIIERIPAPSRMLEVKHEFFYNKIQEYFDRNPVSPYVRFYAPEESQTRSLDYVDQVVRMQFDRFSLGNIISNTYVEEVSRDSVVIAKQDGKNIYGTVKAKLKVQEKSIVGSGLLDFQITDNQSQRVISQEKFPSEYKWTVKWASFNGDERALSEEQKNLVKRTEIDIPSPQYMFEEFAAPLYDQVISKLTVFYRNY